MRHCAVPFRLFLIGCLCSVYFSACTQASSLKESDDELPRAEQWGSDGKRTPRADNPKPILTEDRGFTPAEESIWLLEASENAVPKFSLISKLNPVNWVKGIWTKLRLGYTALQLIKLYFATKGGFDPAVVCGITPLTFKSIMSNPSSGFRVTKEMEKEYSKLVEKFFIQFDGLDKEVPESGMKYWNAAVERMSWRQRLAAHMALSNVRRVLKSNYYSVKELIDLNVSPLVYMRLLDKEGAFATNNKAAIDQLRNYVNAFKSRVEHL